MPTSVRLPDEVERRLDFLATQTGRTKAYYIREIILNHIDELEEYYLAAEILENVRKGKEKVYTIDQVERDLGLAS